MLGKIYFVKQGDTLWDIAGRELGNPTRWPEIYRYNNTMEVIASTGTRINDPDLIFVGQKICIPTAKPVGQSPTITPPPPKPSATGKTQPNPKRPSVPSAKPAPFTGKKPAARKVRAIPFKYDLQNLPSITVASPTHIATVSYKGSITLQSNAPLDFATITTQGFEVKAKSEADHLFGKLVSEVQVGYNPDTKEIKFECGFTTHSNVPYAPKTTVTMGVSSKTALPVLKGSITAPEIKGRISNHFYLASDIGIEIELTPRPPTAKPKPIPVPSARPVPQPSTNWDKLLGGALVVGAGVIIVATLAEDVITMGAGVADDAPSFAAAAAMYASGIAVFKTVEGGTPIKIEDPDGI